jgi:spore germination cell wall hydrolase CwlJ-like protein
MRNLNEEAQKVIDEYDMLLEFDLKKALATAMIGTSLATGPFQAQAQQVHPVTQVGKEWVHDNSIVPKVLAGEAGGEGEKGMYAVACVVQNRMGHTGKTAEQVVTKRKQFSALADPGMMDRNYRQVKETADKIAKEIGTLKDVTGGATHYVTKQLYDKKKGNPKHWISKMRVTKVIGNHVFGTVK